MNEARARFDAKVQITPGCWLWTAAKDKDGYGTFSLRSEKTRAHRAAYYRLKANRARADRSD